MHLQKHGERTHAPLWPRCRMNTAYKLQYIVEQARSTYLWRISCMLQEAWYMTLDAPLRLCPCDRSPLKRVDVMTHGCIRLRRSQDRPRNRISFKLVPQKPEQPPAPAKQVKTGIPAHPASQVNSARLLATSAVLVRSCQLAKAKVQGRYRLDSEIWDSRALNLTQLPWW